MPEPKTFTGSDCLDEWTDECIGSLCESCGFCQGHAYEANRQGEGRCGECHEVAPSLERIERAAVRLEAVLYQDRGTGKRTPLVFDVPKPLRHDSAIMAAAAALRMDQLREHEQGFVTSTGRFVGREEAGGIAFASGQTTKRYHRLMSEHVW